MKLFVFEGKRDSRIFDTLTGIFFPEEKNPIVCVYGSNIYSLYEKLEDLDVFGSSQHDGNTVSVLKEILAAHGDPTLSDVREDEISEVYLFFDYDFQQTQHSLDKNNEQVQKMLEYFDDETGNGKLYIHYPMLESIRYTKLLPDADYCQYSVEREKCCSFKDLVQEFSAYPSLKYLTLAKKESRQRRDEVNRNWEHLLWMNVGKAHFLCRGIENIPEDKSLVSQENIYLNQLQKYVKKQPCRVSILNAFPLFLFEYFPIGRFRSV